MSEDARRTAADAAHAVAVRLAEAGARDELLAEWIAPRRGIVGTRPGRIELRGRVWRLGALLVAADGALYATGEVLYAAEPGHPRHVSQVALDRQALRTAADRARIPHGETVNLFARALPLDADVLGDPLRESGAGIGVRWSASSDALADLAGYLDERAGLLIDPPEGSTPSS